MFDIEDYKKYVKSQVIARAIYLKKDITNELLTALFQFEQAPSKFLAHIPNSRISDCYKKMFDLSDKSNKVLMNNWFLYKYGYKYCTSCSTIKFLDTFSTSNNCWDLKTKYCSTCVNNKSYAWNAENKEKRKQVVQTYQKNNREVYRQASKKYRLNNLDIDAAKTAKRRALKLQATPKWLTTEQFLKILAKYKEAKYLEQKTGIKYHVDHIVPLQGVAVCGLHVPWNLQVITAEENIRKHNKWPN